MFAALSRRYRVFVAHVRRRKARRQQPETIATNTHPFWKLPPELRYYIYRLVMLSKDDNKRRVHTATLPLLACSRRFYQDATLICYCNAAFRLEWFIGRPSLAEVWKPYPEKFGQVSRITISRGILTYNIIEMLPQFPNLWEVELNLGQGGQRSFVLLRNIREQLEMVQRVILVLLINHEEERSDPWDVLRNEYKRGYGDVLDVPDGYLKNRGMRLDYHAPEGDYLNPGALGTLRLIFEQG
jgi:hypothetical protein